ncbi:hypothetical protein SD77_2735 [Bacillus badius]|uniref:Uncharacterized protein n=1 Tax=Bacillus badius TaxID=1455 RepID=A0ABR5ARL7_BACBA|nr:hypothetical protein SD78_4394 [Bacillus badius]KIL75895.1 hypothetical protein SD77_2735 [Bacillus badius]
MPAISFLSTKCINDHKKPGAFAAMYTTAKEEPGFLCIR